MNFDTVTFFSRSTIVVGEGINVPKLSICLEDATCNLMPEGDPMGYICQFLFSLGRVIMTLVQGGQGGSGETDVEV